MTAPKQSRRRSDPADNGQTDDRVPPHNIDAEEAAVGACLIDRNAVAAMLNMVTADDFYSPRLGHIVAAIARMNEQGDGIDAVTVADELRREGLLDDVGGIAYLHALQNTTPSVSNVAQYTASIRDSSRRRGLLALSADIADVAYYEADTLNGALSKVRALFDAVPTDDTVADADLLSFGPVDLGPAWRGEKVAPIAEVFPRDDGVALLPPGINYLFGDSGDGKSFVALIAALEELRAGRAVVWVTYEDPNEDLITARLRLLGASDADVDRLLFVAPQAGLDIGAQVIADTATFSGARLLVLDSVGEAMAVGGVNEDRDNEVGPWFRQTLRLVHDRAPHVAILPIDHSTKAKDNPLFPSGSKRKRAAPTGRMYLLNVGSNGFGRGVVGYVQLVVAKDRGGDFQRGAIAAEIRLDATDVPYAWTIGAPRDGDSYATKTKRRNSDDRVLAALTGSSVPLTVSEVFRIVNAERQPGESEVTVKTVQNALSKLAKRPGVVVTGGKTDDIFTPAKWSLSVPDGSTP